MKKAIYVQFKVSCIFRCSWRQELLMSLNVIFTLKLLKIVKQHYSTWCAESDEKGFSGYYQVRIAEGEHISFLLCWLCKFLLCIPARSFSSDYLFLAKLLASGRRVIDSFRLRRTPWFLYRSCTMAGPEDPHFNIILRIRELMRRGWRCELRHIWREGNVKMCWLSKVSVLLLA